MRLLTNFSASLLNRLLELLTPTNCPLCYWGRLALAGLVGALSGQLLGWAAIIPFIVIMAICALLKWIANHEPNVP